MKRLKILFIVLIVLFTTIAGVIYFTTGSTIRPELSQRTKDFVASRSNDATSDLSNVNFEGDKTKTGIRFDVDGCFSFIMPYKVYNQRIEEECEGYYAFQPPRVSITAYIKKADNIRTVDQADGVSFRRKMSDEYKERKFIAKGREFLIFKKTVEGYEVSAFHYYPGYYLVLNLTTGTFENLDQDLESILKSIEIHRK